MTDIHCHILYGADDGAFCFSESLEMAKVAWESGTRQIIATPHANAPGLYENAWGKELAEKVSALNKALRAEKIPLTVFPGQEVFCAGDVLSKLRDGSLITLNRSRYLLIEFDFGVRAEAIIEQCEELLSASYVPIVAHPERYGALQEDDRVVYRLKKMGSLLQLNKGSLFGSFGTDAQNAAHGFLSNAQADIIASDAHSPYMRTPYMTDAHEMVCELYSMDYAELLFRENPGAVLDDKETETVY